MSVRCLFCLLCFSLTWGASSWARGQVDLACSALLRPGINGNILPLAPFGDPQKRRFQVLELLGSGAFGCVFLINYQGQPAAIKVSKQQKTSRPKSPQHGIPAQVAQLTLLAQIPTLTPFVPPIIEAQGEFLIMPYYPGGTRAQRLRTVPTMKIQRDNEKLMELIFQLEQANIFPADQGNFPENVIFDSLSNTYRLLDPGGLLRPSNTQIKYEILNVLLYSSVAQDESIFGHIAFYLQLQLQHLHLAPNAPLFVNQQLHPDWQQAITQLYNHQKINSYDEWIYWQDVAVFLLGKGPDQAKTEGLINWLRFGEQGHLVDTLSPLGELSHRSGPLILSLLARMEQLSDPALFNEFAELLIGEDLSEDILQHLLQSNRVLREEEQEFWQEWLAMQAQHWSLQPVSKQNQQLAQTIAKCQRHLERQELNVSLTCEKLILLMPQ